MEIKEENVIASYILDDGCKYVFLSDQTVYKQNKDGSLTKVVLNKNNIKRINKEIGEGQTDIIK